MNGVRFADVHAAASRLAAGQDPHLKGASRTFKSLVARQYLKDDFARSVDAGIPSEDESKMLDVLPGEEGFQSVAIHYQDGGRSTMDVIVARRPDLDKIIIFRKGEPADIGTSTDHRTVSYSSDVSGLGVDGPGAA